MLKQDGNDFLMKWLPWILAAIAILAMLVTLLWTRKPAGGDGRPQDVAMQEVLSRLDQLERTRASPTASGRGAPGVADAALGPGGRPGAQAGRDQRTPEQIEADRRRELQTLEASFARDRPDPVRGGQVERTLEQTVTSPVMTGTGLKPEDVAIDCRTSTCRVVGQFAKRGDAEDWALIYITAAGGNVVSRARMAYVERPGGGTEVRVYATRAGR